MPAIVRTLPAAALGCAIVLSGGPPATTQTPDLPDLTITTRQTFEHRSGSGPAVTTVWLLKGPHRRYDSKVESAGPDSSSEVWTQLSNCEGGRGVLLFARSRTYIAEQIDDSRYVLAARHAAARKPASSPAAPEVVITIETMQTGELRQFGRFTASRAITTRTTSPGPGASTPARRDVTDAWYVDVPVDCSNGNGIGTSIAFLSTPGQLEDRVRIEQRGAPPRGFPIETTERHTSGGMTTTSLTVLVSLSEAPLDPALFEVPAGYRPALPLPWGGHDPERPDTILNRARSYLEVAGSWISYAWRSSVKSSTMKK